jgi:hypothetical protein
MAWKPYDLEAYLLFIKELTNYKWSTTSEVVASKELESTLVAYV